MSVEVDHSPARLSSALGVISGLFALTTLIVSGNTLVLISGSFGMVALVVGIRRRSRSTLALGGLGLLLGVVLVGLLGGPTIPLLIASIAVVLSWDVSENAITVGERLGRAAETRQIEVVHIAGTTAVTALSAGIAFLVYQFSAGGESPVALVALLLAGVILTVGLRN